MLTTTELNNVYALIKNASDDDIHSITHMMKQENRKRRDKEHEEAAGKFPVGTEVMFYGSGRTKCVMLGRVLKSNRTKVQVDCDEAGTYTVPATLLKLANIKEEQDRYGIAVI